MSKYDLYRNTICKDDDNDYIILFKDDESAKTVFDEFNAKDQRIAELESEVKQLIMKITKKKDKRIAELETELENLGKTLIYAVNLDIERIKRIAELEKEKQTAIKGFASEIINKILPKLLHCYPELGIKLSFELTNLLKEKGIE